MTRTKWLTAAAVVTLVVAATTWPVRSQYLISWDAANFAFALDKIDIAAHRPHPPGYLGYVFAGRALNVFFNDANAALTAWNIAVRSAGVLLVAMLTFAATRGSRRAAFAAAAILGSSPLVWFYASNAEIYPSEMVLALATVLAAAFSLSGSRSAMYWTAVLLAVTAPFKISATVLLMPVVFYAWWQWPRLEKVRTAAVFGTIFGAIAIGFLTLQPNVLRLLWDQFSGATAPSRLGGTTTNLGRTLNRNLRDTVVNLLAAIGVVNGCAFVVWMLVARRIPTGIDRRVVALWAVPWLLLLLFVHIGNPGYVLPLVPVLCLILGAWYAQLGVPTFSAILILQAAINLAQVVLLVPRPSESAPPRYQDMTATQRLRSDLEPLAFPTLATVRHSDNSIARLRGIADECRSSPWIVVSAGEPVDWRRASYYLPSATAVRLDGAGHPLDIARAGNITRIDGERPITSKCGLIWISVTQPDDLPAGGRPEPGFGWVFSSGSGAVSPAGLSWGPE